MPPIPTLKSLKSGLENRDFSSAEITRAYLDSIAESSLNAFITVDEEGALVAARMADERYRNGTAGSLTGVPIAHKDIFCTQGVNTTCGSKMLASFTAPYDATVVTRLKDAGAVCIGKTNMDEFAMGSSNETSFFGPVKNPWNPEAVPGGSSGGSAAAVAARLVPAATGTDTGGSIRQPASFTGITGLKPTYGRVSRYGMIAFASSLDQGGPMTGDAEDAALLLAHMAGFDHRDSTSANRNDEWLSRLQTENLPVLDSRLRVGLPTQYFQAVDNPVLQTALEQVRVWLEAEGHECVEVSLPHTEVAVAAYYVIAGAEASTNLSRYDGVRFGHRCENPESLEDLYERSRSEGFGDEVKRRILTGTYALSVGYFDAYYIKAQKIRRLIARDFIDAFSEVDLLLTPTATGPAFNAGALTHDPVAMYNQDKFTVPVSLAGLPALSMPCGFDDGLPLGAQLIGPHFAEERILKLAASFQRATDWHARTAPCACIPEVLQ